MIGHLRLWAAVAVAALAVTACAGSGSDADRVAVAAGAGAEVLPAPTTTTTAAAPTTTAPAPTTTAAPPTTARRPGPPPPTTTPTTAPRPTTTSTTVHAPAATVTAHGATVTLRAEAHVGSPGFKFIVDVTTARLQYVTRVKWDYGNGETWEYPPVDPGPLCSLEPRVVTHWTHMGWPTPGPHRLRATVTIVPCLPAIGPPGTPPGAPMLDAPPMYAEASVIVVQPPAG